MASNLKNRLENFVIAALGTTVVLGSYIAWFQGDVRITGDAVVGGSVVQSGGLLPITGSLTLTPSDGSGGILSVQNSIARDLICNSVVLDVTTSPTSDTYMDVGTASGAATQANLGACGGLAIGQCGSGSNIANNLFLSAGSATGVYTLSGSALYNTVAQSPLGASGSYAKSFKLNATDGVTDYINFVATRSQSGSGLAGRYYFYCINAQ
jgi:hypothetical protein|tara:strand:+ start:12517 stop:13146 length:630 start_codon:yes stop_codon:yes gene_type:complete